MASLSCQFFATQEELTEYVVSMAAATGLDVLLIKVTGVAEALGKERLDLSAVAKCLFGRWTQHFNL